jgi:hypothetical protein
MKRKSEFATSDHDTSTSFVEAEAHKKIIMI